MKKKRFERNEISFAAIRSLLFFISSVSLVHGKWDRPTSARRGGRQVRRRLAEQKSSVPGWQPGTSGRKKSGEKKQDEKSLRLLKFTKPPTSFFLPLSPLEAFDVLTRCARNVSLIPSRPSFFSFTHAWLKWHASASDTREHTHAHTLETYALLLAVFLSRIQISLSS